MSAWLILWITLLVTAVFTLAVSISARKIDFGSRLLRERPLRPAPMVGSAKSARKSKAMRSRTSGGYKSILLTPAPSRIEVPSSEPSPPPPAPGAAAYSKEDSYSEYSEAIPKAREDIEMKKEKMDDVEESEEELSTELEEIPEYVKRSSVSDDEILVGLEPSKPVELISEEKEVKADTTHTRDLMIQLPKNMCLDEVFRLRITLSKTEEYTNQLAIKEVQLSKKEADYFALTAKKLGKDILEATTKIDGLIEGSLTVRPISISNVVTIAPLQRTVYFEPDGEDIVLEFYLAPKRWIPDPISILRIEFEQNYRIIRTIDLPIKVYKRQFEALFGFNISKWHKYALLIYGVLSTLVGLYNTIAEYTGWLTIADLFT